MGKQYLNIGKTGDYVLTIRTNIRKIRPNAVEITVLDANKQAIDSNATLETYKPVNGNGTSHVVVTLPVAQRDIYLMVELKGLVSETIPFFASLAS